MVDTIKRNRKARRKRRPAGQPLVKEEDGTFSSWIVSLVFGIIVCLTVLALLAAHYHSWAWLGGGGGRHRRAG